MEIIDDIVKVLAILSAVYMMAVSVIYILLFSVASKRVLKEKGLNKTVYHEDIDGNERAFPVSILVPAYNESVGITSTVQSLVALHYPTTEIIVIDDGSKDDTAVNMIETYDMERIQPAVRKHIETAPILAIYRSSIFNNIKLIIKENGGKSDALNAGINISNYPYFCAIDADSVLENDALLKTMKPIIQSNGQVVVTGGSVRIANGCKISHSNIEQIGLPKEPIVIMQIIEYLRGFLIGRIGLSRLNILLIISGAFGVFNKDLVIQAGGYETKTVGEDMELIVRLHKILKHDKKKRRISYIPDPVCWTEAPSSWKVLFNQRVRWQRGLAETLLLHKNMVFNPKYRSIGLVSLPYFLLVELLGSVFEAVGYLIIITGFLFDFVNIEFALIMMSITILYGSLLSSFSILLEEWTFHKYPKVSHLAKLYFFALTESFWYRPFLIVARIKGLFMIFRKKQTWDDMERKGISERSI